VHSGVPTRFHATDLSRIDAQAFGQLILRQALRTPELADATANVAGGAMFFVHGDEPSGGAVL
jgi:hypothetical protein